MTTVITSVSQPVPSPAPAASGPVPAAPAMPGAALFAEWMGLELQAAPEAAPAGDTAPVTEAPADAAAVVEPVMGGDAHEHEAPAGQDAQQGAAAEAAPQAPAMPAMNLQSLPPALSAALAAPRPAPAPATVPVAGAAPLAAAAATGVRLAAASSPGAADAPVEARAQVQAPADAQAQVQVQAPAQAPAFAQVQAHAQAQAPVHGVRPQEAAGLPLAQAGADRALAAAASDALPPTAAGIAAPAAASADAAAPVLKLAGAAPAWQQPLREALGERLQLQLSRHAEQAVIRLDPPNLGRIDIAIRNIAGALEVNISATHTEVVRQLHAVSDNMRSDLAQRQFSDVSVTINAAPRNPASGQQLAGDQQGRQRQPEQQQDEARAATPGRALAEAGAPASTFTLNSRESYA